MLESASETRYHDAAGLFNRFLKTSPFVELWKFYLAYVRYVSDVPSLSRRIHSQLQRRKMNTGPDTRDTVRKAYEFALNHIGHDRDSSELWVDYIQFLKAGEVSRRIFDTYHNLDALGQTATTWDEGQKMDAIRKAYQRAVQIPMDNVKRMWEEYQEFENNLNKITVSVPPPLINPPADTLHFCVAGKEANIRSDACAYASPYGLDHVARASHGTVSTSASV